jgi:hypothetical protein
MKYETISDAYFDFHTKILQYEINFMLKYNINYQQILYLKFLFFEQYESLYKYLGFDPKSMKLKQRFDVKIINDLYDKGIIENRWIKSKDEMPDVNSISKNFESEISVMFGIKPEFIGKQKEKAIENNKFMDTAGEELFNVYPKTNDSNMVLVACNKFEHAGTVYDGKEDVKRLYAELVNYDWHLHREIVDKVKQDCLQVTNTKITNFVKNKMWELIEILRNDFSL